MTSIKAVVLAFSIQRVYIFHSQGKLFLKIKFNVCIQTDLMSHDAHNN